MGKQINPDDLVTPTLLLSGQGPTLPDLQKREELIRMLATYSAKRRARRRKTVSWSLRMEERLRKDLDDAAALLDNHGVSMTDIVCGLLEAFVPVVLAQRQPPQQASLTSAPDLRESMATLATLVQKMNAAMGPQA